jgi:hypothetical protein
MNRDATIDMDSYRLAKYAVQVPCYVCNGGNTYDAELCRHCFAPMALAHQANTQKLHPRMIAAIGPSGVGKTVYLGMLIDMLSRSEDHLQLLARGAFSINLQQATTSALQQGSFPEKTPNEPDRWNWVHCQVRAAKQRRPVELIMPDLAGEALLEEVEHPRTYEVIRSLLSKSAGVLLLVDACQLHHGEHDQDYFAMKLLSYLIELDDDPKLGWPSRPIAIIMSKADECEECFLDAKAFAEKHASGVWKLCRERFRQAEFFASGVAGACGFWTPPRADPVRIPLRVEPRGIIEPFEWLIGRLGG